MKLPGRNFEPATLEIEGEHSNIYTTERPPTKSLKIIKDFSIVSGFKLNIEKSTGLWIGSLKGSPETYAKIDFTNKTFRCLGLYLSTHLNEGISKTWEE